MFYKGVAKMQYANIEDKLIGKLIFSPQMTRFLLKKNYRIIDIKPDRKDPKQTVFIFRLEPGLIEAMKEYDTKETKERGIHGEKGFINRGN